jgi:CHASE3 domain sensor protein
MTVAKQLSLICFSSLAMFLVVGGTSYFSVTRLIENERYLDRTQVMLEKLEMLMYRITETVAAERGYILTGQDEYLEPYKVSTDETKRLLVELKQNMADNPEQSERLADLEPVVENRLQTFDKVISVYQNPGPDAAIELVRKSRGKLMMDEIRSKVGVLIANEKTVLQKREAETEASSRNSLLTLLFGVVLAMLLVSITSFFTADRIARCVRSLVRSMENIDHGRYDAIPDIGTTDEFGDLSHSLQFVARNLQQTHDQLRIAEERSSQLAVAQSTALQKLHDTLRRLEDLELAAKHFSIRLESEKEQMQLKDPHALADQFRSQFALFKQAASQQDNIGSHYARKFSELQDNVLHIKEEVERGIQSANAVALHSRKVGLAASSDKALLDDIAGLDLHSSRLQRSTEEVEHLANRSLSCVDDLNKKWESVSELQTRMHETSKVVLSVGTRSLETTENYFEDLSEHLERSTHNAKLARQLVLFSDNMRHSLSQLLATLNSTNAATPQETNVTSEQPHELVKS